MPTPATTFRLSRVDLQALDAIAADMGANRSAALRKLVHEEIDRRGLADLAASDFVARLSDNYGHEAVIAVTTDAGASPDGAAVTINDAPPPDARAVLLVDAGELRIEEPDGAGSIVVATMATGQPGELRWEGTLAQLASLVPIPEGSA